MIRFVIRKLLNKKWMTLALLLGNVLLLSLAIATPVYTAAAMQRTLELKFSEKIAQENEYPVRLRVQTPSVRGSDDVNGNILKLSERIRLTADDLGMPMLLQRTYVYLSQKEAESDFPRRESAYKYQIAAMNALQEHISLSGDTEFSGKINEDGTVNAYVHTQVMHKRRLSIGEILTFEDILLPDGSPLRVKIAGNFQMADLSDPYWVDSPADNKYRIDLYIDYDLFCEFFLSGKTDTAVSAVWNVLYDYSDFRAENVETTLNTMARLGKYIRDSYKFSAGFNFTDLFRDFLYTEKQIRTTYLVLQVPVFILLVLFIFMVSSRIAENEEAEIAVMTSRGVSRLQTFLIYILQSVLLTLLAAVFALPLVFPLTKLLLSSNGFLEFIIRNDLKIQLNNHALIYGLIAAAAGILAMLLPITKYAGRSVIGQKEEKRSGMRAQSFWHRYFLDVILLAVSIYGLYSFSGSEEILMSRVIAGESLDPLLFLSTAAFMAGASLFLLRLVPLFEKLLFRLFKEKWSPALFASHRQVLGTRREQGFIMLFLAMTAASGIFYAAAARTVRENDERNLSYLTGADLIAEERWQSNAAELLAKAEAGDPDAANQPLTYYEPNFEKYESLSGFSSATKVYNHAGKLDYTGLDKAAQQLTIMAVEPKKFGETAEFDASLMSVHWYDFLNVLSLREDAVILSANYRAFGISIGDQVYLRTTEKNVNDSIKLTVYGFVDYWPGYKPQEIEIMSDESTVKKDAYLAVFRLDTAQRAWKVLPYEVWMKSEDGGTESFYRLAEEREIPLRSVRDRASLIQAEASSAIKQGTSGIFTVSFILTLVLCTVGFLIYWISSVKNRELQFGVLRAMGLRFREIVAMLLNEQLFVSVSAIAIGYAVGILTSKLYMPLIRVAYSSAEYPVPLELVRMAGDELRLFAVIGIMLLVGLYIIAGIVRRMKISEALKLGED